MLGVILNYCCYTVALVLAVPIVLYLFLNGLFVVLCWLDKNGDKNNSNHYDVF